MRPIGVIALLFCQISGCAFITEAEFDARKDRDQDGFEDPQWGGTDCDDDDAQSFPGAEEQWYDNVDQNCDKRNDYDKDGDGYTTVQYGGADCDDEEPLASPGSLEIDGDGIDNDCDGVVDEPLSADDNDGDGYSEQQGDCNDADVTIFPGAVEEWYDGVDQNCDEANDYDMDGDGFVAEGYGGDDCDDDDDQVYPGALNPAFNCDIPFP